MYILLVYELSYVDSIRQSLISLAMKAKRPLDKLFVDTADDERPVFASTTYSRVHEKMELRIYVSVL